MKTLTYNPPDEPDGRPAPLEGCLCVVCQWVRGRAMADRPVKPSDSHWDDVMRRVNRAR